MMKRTILPIAMMVLCAAQLFGQSAAPDVRPGSQTPGAARPADDAARAGSNAPGYHLRRSRTEVWGDDVWHNAGSTTYNYDAGGFLISTLQETWNRSTNVWDPKSRTTYTNDGFGNAGLGLSESWDDTAGTWVNSFKTTFTYNAANKPTLTVSEIWTNGVWENSARTKNTYDGGGYLASTVSDGWDAGSGSWAPAQKVVYSNNGNGTVDHYIVQLWDGSANAWADFSKVSKTYNSANKAVQELTEIWAETAWMMSRKTTRTFDANGHLTHFLDETWDLVSSSWKLNSQADYTNNDQGDPVLIARQAWNAGSDSWVNTFMTTLEYEGSSGVAVDAASNGSLSVYPNPTNGTFTVTLSDAQSRAAGVQVLNALGEVVRRMSVVGSAFSVDLNGRPAGVYLLRVSNAANTIIAQRKIVLTGAK